jgi:hypothetical protein
MQELYAATIQAPWCFLEFGNVGWCEQPSRLDPRLEKAARRVASSIEREAASQGTQNDVTAETLAHRAQLLRSARTNGEIFLALPANGPVRNSVNESSSLFYVLCGGGSDAKSCKGLTASEAEFRANSGTLPRLAGVALIALCVLGMLTLIGFVVLRLLEAAILSVFYLLLAPVAALAPTFGEQGRGLFAAWMGRLLGSVSAKLLWSMLLGALLATMRILLELEGLGWFVQWILSGALWWGVYLKRHRLLANATRHRRFEGARKTGLARRGEDLVSAAGKHAWLQLRSQRSPRLREQPEDKSGVADALQRLVSIPSRVPAFARERASAQEGAGEAGAGGSGTTAHASLDGPLQGIFRRRRRSGRPQRSPESSRSPSSPREMLEARLSRLREAHDQALANGKTRRAISLRLREQAVQEELGRSEASQEREAATSSPSTSGPQDWVRRPSNRTPVLQTPVATSGRHHHPFAKEAPVSSSHASGKRGESGVASGGLRAASADLGRGVGGTEAPGSASHTASRGSQARAERTGLDRDLDVRKEARPPRSDPTTPDPASPHPARRDPARRDSALPDAARRDPAGRDPARRDPATRDPARRDPARRAPTADDPVMRDAIEVANRRRRQLGWSFRNED